MEIPLVIPADQARPAGTDATSSQQRLSQSSRSLARASGTFDIPARTMAPEPEEVVCFHDGPVGPAVASGVVLGLVNMTLCVSLAAVVYEGKPEYTMMGFDASVLGCALGCFIFVAFCGCPSYVGCPNSVAAVVFAPMIKNLVEELADQEELIIPTVVVGLVVCTLIIGLIFALLGFFRLTKIVQVFPYSVMCGFLACIGFSLFKYSFQVGAGVHFHKKAWIFSEEFVHWDGFWQKFWPGPPLGISLFLLQRYFKLPPVMVWSVYLILPLAMFYIVMFVVVRCPEGMTTLEKEGWMLPAMVETQFYTLWEKGFSYGSVHWATVGKAILEVLPLIPVIIVDVLVGFAATRKQGEFEPTFDGDSLLTGILFWVQGVGCAPLSTNSTKLSLLNLSIAGTRTRVPTLICGLFCSILFFAPPVIAPYFPRFYLGYLLLFNALGFLVKNLYDARHHMTKSEMIIPWVMVYVNMMWGLAPSVIAGFILATAVFAVKYSRLRVVKAVQLGREARQTIGVKNVRTPLEESILRHLTQQIVVVQLQHYLFFGSLMQVETIMTEVGQLQDQHEGHDYLRPHWLIIDWTLVEGMDATVPSVFISAIKKIVLKGFQVMFTGMDEVEVADKMRHEGALKQVHSVFETLHEGLAHVEELLLTKSAQVKQGWLKVSKEASQAHALGELWYEKNMLQYVLAGRGANICVGATRREISPGDRMCSVGQPCTKLFVVQSGTLEVLDTDEESVRKVLHPGACFNEWVLLLGDEAMATNTVVAASEACVLELDHIFLADAGNRFPEQLRFLELVLLEEALVATESKDNSQADVSTVSLAMSSTGTAREGGSANRLGPQPSMSMAMGSKASMQPMSSMVSHLHTGRKMQVVTNVTAKWWSCQTIPLSEAQLRDCFKRNAPKGTLEKQALATTLVGLGCDVRTLGAEPAPVNEQEFLNLAKHLPTGSIKLETVFEKVAANGKITPDTLAAAAPDLTHEQAAIMVADADHGENGHVRFAQFLEAVHLVLRT